MPVFKYISSEKRSQIALVNYKALYSLFSSSDRWAYLGERLTPSIMLHLGIKSPLRRVFYIARDPYERLVSCFKDKLRKQPGRIEEAGFAWQHCHELIFRQIAIGPSATDDEKAAALRAVSPDRFIQMLPELIPFDGHFQPQYWITRMSVGRFRIRVLPQIETVRMEHAHELGRIPDLRIDLVRNSTKHIECDFEWTQKAREVVRSLYAEDFRIASYQP